jgi:hypothetical protein
MAIYCQLTLAERTLRCRQIRWVNLQGDTQKAATAKVTPAFIRLLECPGGGGKESIIALRYLTKMEIAIVVRLRIRSPNLSGFRDVPPQFDKAVLEWRTALVFDVSG